MQGKVFFVLAVCLALPGLSYQSVAPAIFSSAECHPTPSEDKTHYIVGYGSLINAESKNRTYPETGINIPVRVSGFKRTWTARGYSNTSLSTTYLGVEEDPNSYLNGVIFTVPNSIALQKYDERERYYCRVNVPYEDVTILKGNTSDNGTFPSEDALRNSNFWIYVTIPQYREYPNDQYPIVQSYVDIFLAGCIQMERKYGLANFSDECVTKTIGWENPWVNDRVHPRRPFAYQSFAGAIDRLLDRHIEDYHQYVYVERIHVGRSVNAGSQFCKNGHMILWYALSTALLFHL